MSSPQINNLIIAGCILSYTSVLLMGIDSTLLGQNSSESTMNFICAVRATFQSTSDFHPWEQARVWTLSIGFTLSFGAIFSKTWRVHTIFTNVNASKRVSGEWVPSCDWQNTCWHVLLSFTFLKGCQGLPFVSIRWHALSHWHSAIECMANRRSIEDLEEYQSERGTEQEGKIPERSDHL